MPVSSHSRLSRTHPRSSRSGKQLVCCCSPDREREPVLLSLSLAKQSKATPSPPSSHTRPAPVPIPSLPVARPSFFSRPANESRSSEHRATTNNVHHRPNIDIPLIIIITPSFIIAPNHHAVQYSAQVVVAAFARHPAAPVVARLRRARPRDAGLGIDVSVSIRDGDARHAAR